MPSSDSFTPNNVWGSTAPTGVEEDLTLPSGQTCRAKKLSIEGMIEAGVLADADVLTATVNKHVRKVKGGNKKPDGTEVNSMALLKDPQAMKALNGMLCRALPEIVTSPRVKMHYEEVTVGKTTVIKTVPVEDREDGVIYTDQVDFGDKMFLFDWAAGGLQAMLAFRG
jgi:hypothetical protein